MRREDILKYVKADISEENTRQLGVVVQECQNYIQNNMSQHTIDKSGAIAKQILAYVEKFTPVVRGVSTLSEMVDILKREIQEKSIISKYYRVDTPEGLECEEIQLNGPDQIFVKREGRQELVPEKFESDEAYQSFIDKLILPHRLHEGKLYVDMATDEGYRVNATHKSICKHGYPICTIRKLGLSNVNEVNMVNKYESMSVNMYRTLSLVPRSHSSWMCIGGTGSGKTTLNNGIRKFIPLNLRQIYIESPSEIDAVIRKDGVRINNVVQYEAGSVPFDKAMEDNAPSTQRIFINTLRQTPDVIGVGEMRFPTEFELGLQAASSGHMIFSTYHSEGIVLGLKRYLNEVMKMYKGADPNYLMGSICDAIKIVVWQQRFDSGQRKIMEIAEILGSNGADPIVNPLYKFFATATVDGKVVGHFRRVGVLSKEFVTRLVTGMVPLHDYEFLTKPIAYHDRMVDGQNVSSVFMGFAQVESYCAEHNLDFNTDIIWTDGKEIFDVEVLENYLPKF